MRFLPVNKKLQIFLLVCCSIGTQHLRAQSRAGLTEKTDTSYSNYSALESTRKSYPGISLAEFRSENISEKKDIIYCQLNSRPLKLDAFVPKEKTFGKRIAIVIIHGGGWRSGNRSQHYALASALSQRGYVCFTPEYRLSTEALFPAAVYDIKACIRWVREHAGDYQLDSTRIVALGFSAGGELAAFMGTTANHPQFEGSNANAGHSSRVNAVVDIDGTLSFVHPESGEGDDSKHTSAATYWFGYPKAVLPSLWKAASPLTYAGADSPPTLFLNSSVARMHAGRKDYIDSLSQYNIYTEVQEFENSPHSFCLFNPWFEPTVAYIDVFLKKVFPNE